MTIKFKSHPRTIWINRISGILFLAMAIFMTIVSNEINFSIVFAYTLATGCLVLAIFMHVNGYVKIVDDWIYTYAIKMRADMIVIG